MTIENESMEEIEVDVSIIETPEGDVAVVDVIDVVETADGVEVTETVEVFAIVNDETTDADDDYDDDEDFGPVVESPYDRPGRWYVVHT